MHCWSSTQKRLMLAAMLVPWVLVLIGGAVAGSLFATRGGSETLIAVGMGCFVGGFVIAFITALACLADAAIDRRVRSPAPGWAIGLLLAPTVAGVAYWWLHVRMGPGEPHGLQTLRPARAWPQRMKSATGVAAFATLLVFALWSVWIVSFFFDVDSEAVAVPMFVAFGVGTLVACGVIALFVLDALREGGTQAVLWTVLLVLAWPLAAPLYWLLFVRPRGRAGGGP